MNPFLPPAAVVDIQRVGVVFPGGAALTDVDLRVTSHALTVIAGPNGAGKSTLLDVLAGVRTPTTGRISSATRSRAYVPQRTAVSPRVPLTARDIVAVGVWGRIGPWRPLGADGREAVADALERVGLSALQRRPFEELSGGQRQRALLAQGLARRADLLLLDEPTTALDDDSAEKILAAIDSEVARGAAVVCVTHDRAVIARAQRVIRLDSGRIVADHGTIARVR